MVRSDLLTSDVAIGGVAKETIRNARLDHTVALDPRSVNLDPASQPVSSRHPEWLVKDFLFGASLGAKDCPCHRELAEG